MTKRTDVPVRSRAERFAAAVTLRQIRYFIAVAETGKITAAGAMLGISSSVITEAIAELEALSGAKLFDRHPRGLELTYEGHGLLAHARNILSAVERAGAAAIRSDSEAQGTINLAATVTVMGYFLAPLLARFQRVFPNIEVHTTEKDRSDIEKGLLNEDFDLAVMLTSNLSERRHLLTHTLVNSMRRLWLPADHPLLSQAAVTLKDVAMMPYIQLLMDDAEASTSNYWRRHQLKPNIVIRTESVEAIRSFIANRQGVTILSDMMYRPWSLEGDRIEVRELATNIPLMTTGVVWKRDRTHCPAVQTLLNFFKTDTELVIRQSHRNMPPPAA